MLQAWVRLGPVRESTRWPSLKHHKRKKNPQLVVFVLTIYRPWLWGVWLVERGDGNGGQRWFKMMADWLKVVIENDEKGRRVLATLVDAKRSKEHSSGEHTNKHLRAITTLTGLRWNLTKFKNTRTAHTSSLRDMAVPQRSRVSAS